MHCRAGPKNIPRVLAEVVQAFRLHLSGLILKKIPTYQCNRNIGLRWIGYGCWSFETKPFIY